MADFTLKIYIKLIETLKQNGYDFYTFSDWCEKKPAGKIVILRHDIDRRPKHAMKFAELENNMELKSTYYFLIRGFMFRPDIIREIAKLGHEIGYHYRDLVQAKGDKQKAIKYFNNNLELARKVVPIHTISMDGCPWSKYDNRDLWEEYDYHDFGVIGEPYFDFINKNTLYLTDTARMWNGDKYNVRDKKEENTIDKSNLKTTTDFIGWIENSDNQLPLMITTHPQRWTNNPVKWFWELTEQRAKNAIKYFIVRP